MENKLTPIQAYNRLSDDNKRKVERQSKEAGYKSGQIKMYVIDNLDSIIAMGHKELPSSREYGKVEKHWESIQGEIVSELSRTGSITSLLLYSGNMVEVKDGKIIGSDYLKVPDYVVNKINNDLGWSLPYDEAKYVKGGAIRKDFINRVREMHEQIKSVTLKDGTKINGKDLMKEGGELTLNFNENDWHYSKQFGKWYKIPLRFNGLFKSILFGAAWLYVDDADFDKEKKQPKSEDLVVEVDFYTAFDNEELNDFFKKIFADIFGIKTNIEIDTDGVFEPKAFDTYDSLLAIKQIIDYDSVSGKSGDYGDTFDFNKNGKLLFTVRGTWDEKTDTSPTVLNIIGEDSATFNGYPREGMGGFNVDQYYKNFLAAYNKIKPIYSAVIAYEGYALGEEIGVSRSKEEAENMLEHMKGKLSYHVVEGEQVPNKLVGNVWGEDEGDEMKEGGLVGNLISNVRARQIANEWHGGQWSALYQFASSGVYLPESHLLYLREVQENLEPEYYLYPSTLSKKNEAALKSLKRWFDYKGQENGIFTEWKKHPQYGYMIPFLSDKTKGEAASKVAPVKLLMKKGGEFGTNYNIVYEKPESDTAWKLELNAESESEAREKFKSLHPTCTILNIGESYKNSGEVFNNWQVYYMDNDRQKKVLEKNLSYQAAVKASQKHNSEGLNTDYESVSKKLEKGGFGNDFEPIDFPTNNQTEISAKAWLNKLIKERGRKEAENIVRYNLGGHNKYYKHDNVNDSWLSSAINNESFKNGGEVDRFNYMMLSRLQSDCDYFLNYGNRNERVLWAGNVDKHIAEMKRLWNLLPKDAKPQWLSMEEILEYEKKMKGQMEQGGGVDELRDAIKKIEKSGYTVNSRMFGGWKVEKGLEEHKLSDSKLIEFSNKFKSGGDVDYIDEKLSANGFDVKKLTKAQKDLIMQPIEAPEDYAHDGELSSKQAYDVWMKKLKSSLKIEDFVKVVKMYPKSQMMKAGGSVKEVEKYKITYFEKKSQSVKDKTFTGENSFEEAVKWGKKTLPNFNTDLIQKVYMDGGSLQDMTDEQIIAKAEEIIAIQIKAGDFDEEDVEYPITIELAKQIVSEHLEEDKKALGGALLAGAAVVGLGAIAYAAIDDGGNSSASSEYNGRKPKRLKSALMRDRAYKSQEPHEQAYVRKTKPKNPRYNTMEKGGEFKVCPTGMEVQTIMFERNSFDSKEAKAWAKKHDFRFSGIDTTENNIRIRQRVPNAFKKNSFRTIEFGDNTGIKAVVGCLKDSFKK